MKTCTFPGCPRAHAARGYCRAHYTQLRRGVELHPHRSDGPRLCGFPDCGRRHDSKGYCQQHARQLSEGKSLQPLVDRVPRGRRACANCGHEFSPRGGDWDKCSRCRSITTPDRAMSRRAPEGKRWCIGCQSYKSLRFFKGTAGRCNKCRKPYERDRRAQKTYSLPPGRYAEMYAEQGGVCYICRRATGATKALSVDHDHSCCPGKTSCGKCVRGLLCGGCNYKILGHLRDDVAALQRAIDYLNSPPAQRGSKPKDIQ